MSNAHFHKATKNYFLEAEIDNFVLDKGKTLFKQGDCIDYIYFLSEGELNILKNSQMMWQAYRNEFIGISSFFIGELNYSYSVKACKNSVISRISLKDFKNALNTYPTLNTSLMKLFCSRINLTLDKVSVRSKLTRKMRLVNVLIEKAKKIGKKEQLVLSYTVSDIAEFVNVSHNFAKELLYELQSKNLIKIRKADIEITDFTGLKLVSQMKGVINTKE